MGNRAVISFKNQKTGIYLHWNGGIDSVESFLKYAELKDYRSPSDDIYGIARLVQVIANFFGGTTSIGIGDVDELDTDNGDNGMYIVEDWKIVGREFKNGPEQRNFTLSKMLKEIDLRQPLKEQIFANKTSEEIEGILIEKGANHGRN